MSKLYPESTDELPPHMPESLGNPINVNCFVDSDCAGNWVTRQSHTRIVIFVNMPQSFGYARNKIQLRVQAMVLNLLH